MGLRETRRVQSRASSTMSTLSSSSLPSLREQTVVSVLRGVPGSKNKGAAASNGKEAGRSRGGGQRRTTRATAQQLVSAEGVLRITFEWSTEFAQQRSRRLVGEMEGFETVALWLNSFRASATCPFSVPPLAHSSQVTWDVVLYFLELWESFSGVHWH